MKHPEDDVSKPHGSNEVNHDSPSPRQKTLVGIGPVTAGAEKREDDPDFSEMTKWSQPPRAVLDVGMVDETSKLVDGKRVWPERKQKKTISIKPIGQKSTILYQPVTWLIAIASLGVIAIWVLGDKKENVESVASTEVTAATVETKSSPPESPSESVTTTSAAMPTSVESQEPKADVADETVKTAQVTIPEPKKPAAKQSAAPPDVVAAKKDVAPPEPAATAATPAPVATVVPPKVVQPAPAKASAPASSEMTGDLRGSM